MSEFYEWEEEIHVACELAKKWLPPVTENNKIIMREVITGTENYGTAMLRKYIKLLRPYGEVLGIASENDKPREPDCVASGIVFFYVCLLYIMHFDRWGEHIEDIFLYNMLYILVDHYIDDCNVSDELKEKGIRQMYILIEEPTACEYMDLVDPVLETIAVVYKRLITRCPESKELLVKLFETEVKGKKIQSSGDCLREEYYETAIRKGGYSIQVLQSIVGNKDEKLVKGSFDIGSLLQLIDDANDVSSDIKNGINTIATHDLKSEGVLDRIWIDIIKRINAVDSKFSIFKIVSTIFAIYIPDRYRNNFSENLWEKTNKINLFDYHYGFDASKLLVNAIMDEMNTVEILEKLSEKNIEEY